MRFSSLFQHTAPPQPADQELARAQAAEAGPLPSAPVQELPEDLDARVRLLGEWQLLEG